MVLDKMKTTAEAYLGAPVRNAVVTVPAYFNDAQRQATKDAAVIAGLNVLRIINEPTAGALAYGLDQAADDERLVLIYDLGGGTFDVSILCIEEGIFEVRATAGDTRLGGEDIDVLLANYLVNEFKNRHGVDISGDRRAVRRLRTASERAKRTLSSQNEATVELDGLYEGLDMNVKVSRAKFEEICEPLLRRTLEPLRQAMADAKLEPSDLNEVVLVGGSTRIPRVKELLRDWYEGRELAQTVNPDEAVAIGAAVQAANLDGDAANVVSDLVLLDVTPLSLGTTLLGKITDVIIPRNTTIPVKKQKQYTTVHDYQTEVRVEVVEGERQMSKDNNLLGYFNLTGLTPAPAGVPKILDTFEIDADGILHVNSVEVLSNVEKSITVKTERNRLSQEQIRKLIAEAEEFKAEDQAKKEAAEARHELERFCYTIKNRASANTSMPSSTRQSVISKCEDTTRWLEKNQQAPIQMYRRKKRDLELVANLAFVNL